MREKIEMKTHTLAVAQTSGWPMLLTMAACAAAVWAVVPFPMGWQLVAILAGVLALLFLWCMRLYLGTYLFLPATEIKGARIIARLGKNADVEISGVLAGEIIVKQGPIEKLCGVCLIRQRGTMVYLRGVKEPEKIRVWVDANFPKERKSVQGKGKKSGK